ARLLLDEPLPLRQALHVLLGLPETLGELDAIRDRPRVEGDRPAIGFEGPRPIPRRIERLPVREVARGVERPFGERTVPLRARGRPLSLVAQLLGEGAPVARRRERGVGAQPRGDDRAEGW